ncbi:MAG TPA: lysylphosphatidylglycerol synthase domain-containing protein, partial [Draconibacterium sp.]|nr:lysylphosphatidylglycerol synthase domain-containing protein [Draconibacterium sp.]
EIFGLLFLYHLIGVVAFFCFAKSLNIDVNIWVIGWVRSAIYILVMLPFSFAGFGIREGILVFLLSKYGVLPNDSMALSFIFFFSQNLLFSLVGGLFDFKSFIEKKY